MKKLLYVLLFAPMMIIAQTTSENYVVSKIYKKATTTPVIGNDKDKASTTIQYFDGLGRPKQSIAIQAGGTLTTSETPKDIITHYEYDALGRQVKEYLPYAVSTTNGNIITGNIGTATESYYKNKYSSDFLDANLPINAYSEKQFDNSPLNRIQKQAAPGQDWRLGGGHEIKFDYQTNILNEVKIFGVTTSFANNTYTPILIGGSDFYTARELYKTVTKDENWTAGLNHTTEEFKNKQGQVILKRTYADVEGIATAHDTYYVYDDFGNLSYVLPPLVNATETASTLAVIQSKLNDLGYQYKYDHRNRLVAKRIPGKDWEYIVYDKLDRPVLTQDTNLKAQKKWLFTKYDVLGRIVYTGYLGNTVGGRIDLQNVANTGDYTQYEVKTTNQTYGDATIYYSKTAIPTGVTKVYTINYYDTYVDLPSDLNNTVTTSYGVTSTTNTKGLPTVNKTKILGTNNWITTVSYYDEKARPIYVYSKNEELNTIDILESKLDAFTGKVLETRTTHKKTGKATIVTIDSFVYDHMNRLLSQSQCIGDETLTSCNNPSNTTNAVFNTLMNLDTSKSIVDNNSITFKNGFHVIAATNKMAIFSIAEGNAEHLVANTYDDLGQLQTKKVGNTIAEPLQTVDYKYNVRGWLKNINEDNITTDNDLFNFTINYNNPTSTGTALFNGNISQTSWNTLSVDKSAKMYNYRYDALSRITSAIDNTTDKRYSLTNVSYDKMGNITALSRNGHRNVEASNFGVMDDLTYSYDNGNKLMRISDAATVDQFGFKDDVVGSTPDTSNDYTYDVNGNMLTDTNKGITSNILYNHLSLPTQINVKGQVINYTYDAAGNKLKKVTNGVTTEYAGNYRYVGGELKDFKHPEGYVKNDGGTFNYVYSYTDHLGNVRLNYADLNNDGVIQAATEILDEKNYYPFGGTHGGYNTAINGAYYPFGYNGKEENDENGLATLDFGARNYDKWAGRWMNLDPLAEQMRRHSPYNYAFDNPVYFIDPDGMMPQGPGDPPTGKQIKEAVKNELIRIAKGFQNAWSSLKSSIGDFNVNSDDFKDTSSSKRESGDGDGYSYVTDSGQPAGDESLVTTTTGNVTEVNITGVMALAVVAGGKKTSSGNGKTNASNVAKKNAASSFSAGRKSVSNVGNLGSAVKTAGSISTTNTASEVSNETTAVNYTMYTDTQEIDSTKTKVRFTGAESEVKRKIDSTDKSSSNQRKQALSWFD